MTVVSFDARAQAAHERNVLLERARLAARANANAQTSPYLLLPIRAFADVVKLLESVK